MSLVRVKNDDGIIDTFLGVASGDHIDSFIYDVISNYKNNLMNVQELIHTITDKEEVKSYLIEILEAFQKMDYYRLNDLLRDDCFYQDMTKTSFLLRQKEIFYFFQKQGDTFLNVSTNICTECLCNKPVFVLTGNNSETRYGIYIEFVKDEIVDIFLCSQQSSYLGQLPF